MTSLAQEMKAATTKGCGCPAALVLEDGTIYRGTSCGAQGSIFGEICFNTSLVGYLEVLTDPSYAGQIIVMTYPQIGNYGVAQSDIQRDQPALRGLVVRDLCTTPSNWRSELSLPEFLAENGIVGIEGIDTRALVRKIREQGAMKAGITTNVENLDDFVQDVKGSLSLEDVNLAQGVSCSDPYDYELQPTTRDYALSELPDAHYNVVAYDCGAKDSILENLVRVGCTVQVVPWNTPAEEVLALNPDGVFFSNGPGDPETVDSTYEQVEKLLGKVPVFGICLGHQMICKATGASTYKLKYGHRGGNHPVMNLLTGRVEITAQNHGFNLDFPSLGKLVEPEHASLLNPDAPNDLRVFSEKRIAPIVHNDRFGRIQLTHVNLNDGTAEGVAFLDFPAFSVQYHPEASPGPTDAHYLFSAFTRLMDGRSDYLDIDIASDRLAGWRF